jgi:hypothetical protein
VFKSFCLLDLAGNSKILSFRSGKFFQGFKEVLKWFEEACLQD